jgi:hypothetical protein
VFLFPHFTFTKLDGRPHFFHWSQSKCNISNWAAGSQILRSAGSVDEPGAFVLMLNYFFNYNEITLKIIIQMGLLLMQEF